MEYVTLNNGVKMPMLGAGTFLMSPDEAEASVYSALTGGIGLVDTANAYLNEKAVGRAMARSGLSREDIFPRDQTLAQLLRAAGRRGQDAGTPWYGLHRPAAPSPACGKLRRRLQADGGRVQDWQGARHRPEQHDKRADIGDTVHLRGQARRAADRGAPPTTRSAGSRSSSPLRACTSRPGIRWATATRRS